MHNLSNWQAYSKSDGVRAWDYRNCRFFIAIDVRVLLEVIQNPG
jgi:hypothetical protein